MIVVPSQFAKRIPGCLSRLDHDDHQIPDSNFSPTGNYHFSSVGADKTQRIFFRLFPETGFQVCPEMGF